MERQDFRNYKSVHQLQYSCTALITLETAAENHAIGGGNLSKLDFCPLSLIHPRKMDVPSRTPILDLSK